MKPTSIDTTTHLSSGIEESIQMRLSANDFSHIASVLTNLYSDRVLACIREYSTNAWDSHVEAGNKAPIQIALPLRDKAIFEVKDFGIGLNVDDIRDIYSLYGRSTKRESNEVNGVLGLGCKAALCYAVSFTVVGVKDGVKTVALVTKDKDGVGSIEIMDTLATEEPNGVTVQIPVQSSQVQEFRDKARKFFSYWEKGTVLVDDEEPASFRDDNGWLWIDEDVAVKPEGATSYLVMGNVVYPVPSGSNLRLSTVAYIPMGSVHFTPSRESLQMTRHTQDTISLLHEYVEVALGRRLREQMESLSNLYQRAKLYHIWRYCIPNSARIAFLGFFGVTKGRRNSSDPTSIQATDDYNIWDYDPNTYGNKKATSTRWLTWDSIVWENITFVYDFPYKTVAAAHRERVRMMGFNRCIFLPVGCATELLDGRPNTVSWDKVLVDTGGVIPPIKERKTRYTYYMNGVKGQTTEFDDDEPLLYITSGDHVEWSLVDNQTKVVSFGSRQTIKFLKTWPQARPYHAYRTEKVKEWQDSLTDEDKLWFTLSSSRHNSRALLVFWNLVDSLPDLDKKLLDPILRELATKLKTGRRNLVIPSGATVPPARNPYPDHLEKYPLMKMFDQYGRLSAHSDILLYLNAKFESIQPQVTVPVVPALPLSVYAYQTNP